MQLTNMNNLLLVQIILTRSNSYLEYKEFRNKIYLILVLKSKVGFVKQPIPLIRKTEYKSPLLIK